MKIKFLVLTVLMLSGIAHAQSASVKALVSAQERHSKIVQELLPLLDTVEKNIGATILCDGKEGTIPGTEKLLVCLSYVKAMVGLKADLKSKGIETVVFENRGVPHSIIWTQKAVSFSVSGSDSSEVKAVIERANLGNANSAQSTYYNPYVFGSFQDVK